MLYLLQDEDGIKEVLEGPEQAGLAWLCQEYRRLHAAYKADDFAGWLVQEHGFKRIKDWKCTRTP